MLLISISHMISAIRPMLRFWPRQMRLVSMGCGIRVPLSSLLPGSLRSFIHWSCTDSMFQFMSRDVRVGLPGQLMAIQQHKRRKG